MGRDQKRSKPVFLETMWRRKERNVAGMHRVSSLECLDENMLNPEVQELEKLIQLLFFFFEPWKLWIRSADISFTDTPSQLLLFPSKCHRSNLRD